MYLPTGWKEDLVTVNQVWDTLPIEGSSKLVAEHGGGAGAHGAAAGHGAEGGHAEAEAGEHH
jgi:hypothetical protein